MIILLDIIQKFVIIYIIVFCFEMIYFYFRNKSKKHSKIPTAGMALLIRTFGIDVVSLGVTYVQRDMSLINAFIASIDVVIYLYLKSILLKVLLMFVVTLVLIFIFYTLLAKRYKKILSR